MSTLAVVEEILRQTARPMSVKEIVELAGESLPTKSKTPDTVVARDLSMDIKKKGEESAFIRTAPGRYTMREIYLASQAADARAEANANATSVLSSVMKEDRAGPLSASAPRAASAPPSRASSAPSSRASSQSDVVGSAEAGS